MDVVSPHLESWIKPPRQDGDAGKHATSLNRQMRSTLSMAAAATSLLICQAPAAYAEGKEEDLGVMSIKLQDVVKPDFGFQGETQGAGTPNQAGVGGFLPLKINENSVWFVDALANVNFADFNTANSSLGDTQLDGLTISTSTRLGYRWLNADRSWMFGINAGYDSRPVKSGDTVNGYKVKDLQTPLFQQVAVTAEAVHKKWNTNAYALIPIGEYGLGSDNVAILNSHAGASALTTFGFKIGYAITDNWELGAGYYYEMDEKSGPIFPDSSEGSGVQAALTYNVNNQLVAGVTYSYDNYFESRVSGKLTWRFNGGKAKKIAAKAPVLLGLGAVPDNRNVRVANSKRHYRYYRLEPSATGTSSPIASSSSGSTHIIVHKDGKVHHVQTLQNPTSSGQSTSSGTSTNTGTTTTGSGNSTNPGTTNSPVCQGVLSCVTPGSKGHIVDHGKYYHPGDLDGKTIVTTKVSAELDEVLDVNMGPISFTAKAKIKAKEVFKFSYGDSLISPTVIEKINLEAMALMNGFN